MHAHSLDSLDTLTIYPYYIFFLIFYIYIYIYVCVCCGPVTGPEERHEPRIT